MPKTKAEVNKERGDQGGFQGTARCEGKEDRGPPEGEKRSKSTRDWSIKSKRSARRRSPERLRKPDDGRYPRIVFPNGVLAHSSKAALGVGASIAVAKAAAEKISGWSALKEIVDALA